MIENALDSQGERYVCVIVHPISAEVEYVRGLRDASSEVVVRHLGNPTRDTPSERARVDVLGAFAVCERRVQDHHSTAVYDEAYLPPERTV